MFTRKSLVLVEPELNGGRISRETIDQIAAVSCSDQKISGLTQETFEYLIDQYGKQLKKIEFWKCPRVLDLSQLSSLVQIESVSFYWNQKAEELWDMAPNSSLRELVLRDFKRLRSLEELACCNSLEKLKFGSAVSTKMEVASLEPVALLPNLRHLDFNVKRIVDGRIAPLSKVDSLKSVEFPTNLFSTEKVAWLRARLEKSVKSKVLRPMLKFPQPVYIKNGKKFDTLIIGKRKPFLDSRKDKKRIREYKQRFRELVAAYKADPAASEPA